MIEPQPRSRAAMPPADLIRDGSSCDLDGVMAVMESAFWSCFGEGWTRSQCSGILPMTGVRLRIAGEAPDGFSLMRMVADEAELLLIGVVPTAQRRGIGQALVDDFVALARAFGATNLHLEVRDGNPALSLYRANGFVLAGRRRDYYHGPDGDHHDALTLTLRPKS